MEVKDYKVSLDSFKRIKLSFKRLDFAVFSQKHCVSLTIKGFWVAIDQIYRNHALIFNLSVGLEIREDIDTVLEPGMVVSMEPMIMIPEGQPGAGGYREHDILIVTDTGAENITKFPFGPEHNIL